MKKRNLGFSLTEIIIVVGILSVLVTAMVPTLIKYIYRAKVSVDISNGREIGAAVERLIAENDTAFYGFFDTRHRTGMSIIADPSNPSGVKAPFCIVEWNNRKKGKPDRGQWEVGNNEQIDFHHEWVKYMPNSMTPVIRSLKGPYDHWVLGYQMSYTSAGVKYPDVMSVQIWIVEGDNTTHWQGGGTWHKVYPNVSIDSYINEESEVFFKDNR